MKEGLKDIRKQMFAQMNQKLHESCSSEEDSLFCCHSSEDRIVLSHALFRVMAHEWLYASGDILTRQMDFIHSQGNL